MTTSVVLQKLSRDRVVKVAGLVIAIQRPPTAKGNCFITLEDEFGTMDVVVKLEVYEKCKEIIAGNRFLLITARVQVGGIVRSLLALNLERIEGVSALNAKPNSPGEHPRSLSILSEEYMIIDHCP
jgi:error-prone DNA polymerase